MSLRTGIHVSTATTITSGIPPGGHAPFPGGEGLRQGGRLPAVLTVCRPELVTAASPLTPIAGRSSRPSGANSGLP